jgi:hypothetical protein
MLEIAVFADIATNGYGPGGATELVLKTVLEDKQSGVGALLQIPSKCSIGDF